MPFLALRLLKSRIALFVAVAGVVLPCVLWYLTAHANRKLPEMAAQSGDDGPDLQQPLPDVRIDYDAHRVVRQAKWSTPLDGYLGLVRPPHLLGDADRVYISHGDGVTALDYQTGTVLWHSAGPQDRMCLSGDLLLATDCGSSDLAARQGRLLVARDAAKGGRVFQAQLPTEDFDPQPIRKVAGLFLVQVTEAPGGKGAAFLFDRQGRLRHRLDREVVDGRAFGENRVLLTSRDVVGLGPDDRPTWTAPFDDREWLAGGGIVDLPGGDLLAFLYGEINDSGVRVMRVRPNDGTVVWQAFCSPLGVSHSAYSHQATVAAEDGLVKVVSRASGGEFVEFLDVQSGRQLRRSQNLAR